jgi:hypothetical protein
MTRYTGLPDLCASADIAEESPAARNGGYMSANSPVFRMLHDLRAAAEGDTVDMNRERAETYLRVLAEAELRRATSQPWGSAQRAGYAARVKRVAQVLAFVGALDDGVADQILDDFELALGARQTGQADSVLGSFIQRAAERTRLARRVSVPPAAAGRSAAARSGTGMAAGRTCAPVRLGQIVRVCGADVDGEVYLLSYARVASGPQFSVFARERQPAGLWEPSGPRLFDPFTATDDRGTSYQVTIRDIGSPVLGWTLMLLPDPAHGPQWLDLATTGGGASARIVLPAAAGEPRPPAATDVTVSQTASSPGEHLLSTIAARLLAAVPPLPHDPWLYGTAPRPRALPSVTDGLGDVIPALQECGALSPLSQVPGQLAMLCARLNVTGHGITTPPARDLPEPWLSVLTQYQQRETGAVPVRDGCAAAAVVLPELDGIQLTILGLHNCQDNTIMHMHATGPMCDAIHGPDELYAWPPIWVCDGGGHWHATRTSGQSGMNGEIALRLEIVPPLSRATTWIEVRAIGQSAEARARLPLRWQSL